MHTLIIAILFGCFIIGCGSEGNDTIADATDAIEGVVDMLDEDSVSDPVQEDGSGPEVECDSDGDCNDNNPCTEDTCDMDYGVCEHDPIDVDGDGYPAEEIDGVECGGADCDDTRNDVYPGADSACDGEDHDCSGRPDSDEDGDGFFNAELCPESGDDCDDGNPDVHPGVPPDCQAFDADCDGRVENDLDGDEHISLACGGNDCDDEDDSVYWDAFELACDGKDTDCNGSMSELEDADHDGYANEDCAAFGREVDCDDGNGAIFPGATEVCDMIDQDCDGTWADGGADDDLDGYLDDDCGGNDCDDTLDDVFPDAAEICNDGVDQDCDGLVDGLAPILDDVRITNDTEYSWDSSLVWTGTEFGVTWSGIRFARFAGDGAIIGSDVEISNGGQDPSIVWNGAGFGICWSSWEGNEEIYFARVSETGSRIGDNVRITNVGADSVDPSLVWTGSEYGVSWHDYRDGNEEIYFARIDEEGNKIGSDIRVTDDINDSSRPSLVWTDSEYGISWEDNRDSWWDQEIYFARISAAGVKIGTDVRITSSAGGSNASSLIWIGSEFGVTWMDDRDGGGAIEIYFARISSAGDKVGTDVRITSDSGWSHSPSLVWSGSEYGVSWVDDRNGNDEIYISQISADGIKLGVDARITNDDESSWNPSLAWTGSEFAVSWEDERDGNGEIYFNRVGWCD